MIAMLLAGGQGSRLGVLTSKLAKPAVAFGGKYKIIDFPLSNCINSGIDTVGVLTQYQPLRLNQHIGIGIPWDLDRNIGGVSILPPYEKSQNTDWYTGTANAIYQNMEFKSLTNIETSFRQIRLFALVFICLCALVTGFAVWNSYSFAEKQRQKIYVLDNGKSLMLALSQDMAQNRPVEAKSHVRRFHELFFTLSPEKGAIESNIKRSLFLADKTAFNYYKDLAEKGYYNRVISGNVTQTVEIDSVKCDFDQYPYKVNTYARQLIVRESSLTVRSLVTSCRLLNATRSDNNPHGFIIEAFTITENKDLQTIKR